MAKPVNADSDHQREFGALVQASEHLRRRCDELVAEMDELRRRMAQFYIDVAGREEQRRKPHRPAK